MSAVAAEMMESVFRENASDIERMNTRTRVARHAVRMLRNPEYVRALQEESVVAVIGKPATEVLASLGLK